jgi:hypothetical protein
MFYQNNDGGYRSKINFNVGQFRGSIKPIAICVGNFFECAPHDESRVITLDKAELPDIPCERYHFFLGLTGTNRYYSRVHESDFGLLLKTGQNVIYGKPAGPGLIATRNSHLNDVICHHQLIIII